MTQLKAKLKTQTDAEQVLCEDDLDLLQEEETPEM
jgi:hypothetical protein